MDKSPRQLLLEEAIKITTGNRNKQYGSPEDNFRNIANFWVEYLKAQGQSVDINPADVAIMMALMKIARLSTNQTHRDSAVDTAGYMACLADIQESMQIHSLTPSDESPLAMFVDGGTIPDSLRNRMTKAVPLRDIEGVKFSNEPTCWFDVGHWADNQYIELDDPTKVFWNSKTYERYNKIDKRWQQLSPGEIAYVNTLPAKKK